MIKHLLIPNSFFQRLTFLALGFLVISFLLTPTSAKAVTSPAANADECNNAIHEHHFVPNPDDPTGLGTCEDGRAPIEGDDSSEEEGAPEEGTASLPVIGIIQVPDAFPTDPSQIIASAVTVLLGIAGLIFFIVLLLGGIRYLTAGGDEKATMQARQTLTNAFIGLIIVIASFLIAQILFAVFGLDALVNVI